jgi:hypothetical protein
MLALGFDEEQARQGVPQVAIGAGGQDNMVIHVLRLLSVLWAN